MTKRGLYWILSLILVVTLAIGIWVRVQAQEPAPGDRPSKETQTEGTGVVLTGSMNERTSDQMLMLGGGLPLMYTFPGAADDGLNGVSGKMATSISCTNTGLTAANFVVTVFTYSGASYYSSGILALPINTTYTISTQNTLAFAEDVWLHTPAINQGYATVRSDSPRVICSGFLVDPTGNPPVFLSELEGYR